MKKLIFITGVFALLLFATLKTVTAQSNTSGEITYARVVGHSLKTQPGKIQWNHYVASLPKHGKVFFKLSFTKNKAMYEKDISKEEARPMRRRRAPTGAYYGKPPKSLLIKVFYNLEKGEKTEQVNFMTRNFQIDSKLKPVAWRLTSQKKKVGKYICQGAEIKEGKQTTIAWFTSQIPVAVGPDKYHGLPGTILAIEKNSKIVMLATSVNLTDLEEGAIKNTGKGKKMSQKQFDRIKQQKIEEFKRLIKNKKAKPGGEK